MKSKILLGLVLAIPIFIFSYSIVKVPTLEIPDNYYTNSSKYVGKELNIVTEYHISFTFVRINKCDVICPNERGFPFMIKYISEHDELKLEGLLANTTVSVLLGTALANCIYGRNQYHRKSKQLSKTYEM